MRPTRIRDYKMRELIQSIIQNEIPKGCVFDAHSIIEYLIQNQSDVYLSSYQNGQNTAHYHSEISKTITEFESSIIKRVGKSWSMNIHGKFSENVCWIKL